MHTGDPATYRQNLLERGRADGLKDAFRRAQKVTAKFTGHGGLEQSRYLVYVAEAYKDVLADAVAGMVASAFEESGGAIEDGVVRDVEAAARRLRQELSDNLTKVVAKRHPSIRSAGEPIGVRFEFESAGIIESALDDFRNGMLKGRRLLMPEKDHSGVYLHNSPGSVVHTGTGSVQVINSGEASSIRTALSSFMASDDVQALTIEQRQELNDVVEVINAELDRTLEADRPKILRWGKKLWQLAKSFGVSVAANVFVQLLPH